MNERILKYLGYLKVLRNIEDSIHSVKALERTIDNIERSNIEIISGKHAKELFSGVGKGTSFYIDQILKNSGDKSGIKDLDNASVELMDKIKSIHDLIKIQGIGYIKALEYYNSGVKNINQLSPSLTTRQSIGVKYHNEFSKRIPREKTILFCDHFHHELNVFNQENTSNLRFNVMGSFIRGLPDSGDIDIILFSEIPNEVLNHNVNFINKLTRIGLLKEQLSQGKDSYQGVAFIDDYFPSVRIDIKFINLKNELPYAILYFTGSKNFNEYIRTIARNLGFKLGNTEMVDSNGKQVFVEKESDIFKILNINYLNPTQRN